MNSFNPQIAQLSQPRLAAIGTALHDAANDPRVVAADNARQILNAWGVEPKRGTGLRHDLGVCLRHGNKIDQANADNETIQIHGYQRKQTVFVYVAGQLVFCNWLKSPLYIAGPWESELAGIVRQIEAKAALRAEVARRTDGHLVLRAA